MKTCRALLTLACVLAVLPIYGQAPAPSPAAPPVALVYPYTNGIAIYSIPAGSAVATAPCYAYGGEELTLPMTAQAPLGTHLRIYADVAQQTSGLAVPWLRHAPVSEEIVFGDRTSVIVGCKLPALPAVQRKTRVSITLRTEPKLTEAPEGLRIDGFVYPRPEPGAWKKQFAALLTRAGVRRVVVFGPWKNTAGFLRGQKIAFEDGGDDWPAEPDAHTLYLGSVAAKKNEGGLLPVPRVFSETPGVRLVLFEPWETETLLPGVYQTASATGGGVWKVTLPDLFAGAGLDDPHALETLTTIFQQVLAPRQPATGDSPEPTP